VRIGFLSEALPYLPSAGGFRIYGGNILRSLARKHEIDLISLLQDDDEKHLGWARPYCRSVETLSADGAGMLVRLGSFASTVLRSRPLKHRAAMAHLLASGVEKRHWDILHVEGSFVGALVPLALDVPRILSLHDSLTLRCEEMLRCSRSLREKLYYRFLQWHEPCFERHVYPRFERCVVVAERDRQAVQETVPESRVTVIPYGVDSGHYRACGTVRSPASVVFHGNLSYAPNVDAVMEFADRILPLIHARRPDVTFHLVAADPIPQIAALASRPRIRLTVSPPDVRPAVSQYQVYVCPMRHGTGMKNKILEALSLEMPIVCYEPALAGIDCEPGRHVIVARDAGEFSRRVLDLFDDEARCREMGRAGRDLVVERYSWDARAREFEALYEQIILERRAGDSP
jgi:glycosyltransferase involved in cell wall biosynthesis